MTTDEKSRTAWGDLPEPVHEMVGRILGGRVTRATSQIDGFSPGSADRVQTADGRRAFVKAVHHDHNPGALDLHRREIRVMSLLPASVSAPTLLGSYDHDGWAALVLDDIDGSHPGEALDGTEVTSVLDAFATFPRLEPAQQAGLSRVADEIGGAASWRDLSADGILPELPEWAQTEIARLTASAERAPAAVEGDHLQHLDGRADNILVDSANRAWIVDWPWAGVGARWVDGLMYLFDCRVRGETVDTERALRVHPLFAGVPAASIDSVLAAVTGGFLANSRQPAPPNMPTLRAFQRKEALAGVDWLRQRWVGAAV